jgi:hypothetical protein
VEVEKWAVGNNRVRLKRETMRIKIRALCCLLKFLKLSLLSGVLPQFFLRGGELNISNFMHTFIVCREE